MELYDLGRQDEYYLVQRGRCGGSRRRSGNRIHLNCSHSCRSTEFHLACCHCTDHQCICHLRTSHIHGWARLSPLDQRNNPDSIVSTHICLCQFVTAYMNVHLCKRWIECMCSIIAAFATAHLPQAWTWLDLDTEGPGQLPMSSSTE